MPTPWNLDGVDEKLQRAKENIINVSEVLDAILGTDRNRIFSDDNEQAVYEFVQAHLSRSVTPRISVLAAECIHNLRSALDQLAWQLVIAAGCRKPDGDNRFPLLIHDPTGNEKATASYNRSVKGMSAAAKAYILALQPYQPDNGGKDHKLRILHDLNITDKHHQLVIVKNAVRTQQNISFKMDGIGLLTATVERLENGAKPKVTFNRPVTAMQVNRQVSIQVTFAEFGASTLVPVVDGLWGLHGAVKRVVDELRTQLASSD